MANVDGDASNDVAETDVALEDVAPKESPVALDPSTPVSDVLSATDVSKSSVNYDALYDADTDEDEDVDMKSHGSVITHLLSQVHELLLTKFL